MTQFATRFLRLALPGVVCLALTSACGSDKGSSSGAAGATASGGSAGVAPGSVAGSSGTTTIGLGGSSGNNANGGSATSGGPATDGGSATSGGSATGGGPATTGGGPAAGGGPATGGEYPAPGNLADETGADLWLRYPKVALPGRLAEYQAAFVHVVSTGGGASTKAATDELVQGLSGLTGNSVTLAATVQGAGSVVVGTPTTSPLIAGLPLASELSALGPEGYLVRATEIQGQSVIVVAANSELGVLYGSFALLRQLATHGAIAKLSLSGSPKIKNRLLNHWDNLDGTIERGYAGKSLWNWSDLPGTLSPRYTDYARANASIGINGVVLNNVNADAQILTAAYLGQGDGAGERVPSLRHHRLPCRRSSARRRRSAASAPPIPRTLGQDMVGRHGQRRSTRRSPTSAASWSRPTPRGNPARQTYGRTHADGANMLAAALAPHGGIVMWRAFVYDDTAAGSDRIKQAYDEFKPLDGKFDANVIVQVKNGPLDFQPREPFHPLFGAMPQHAAGARAADHQGVPGRGHAPRLPRAAVRGSPEGRHLRARGRARPSRASIDGTLARHTLTRHRRRGQHRQRHELDGLALQPGQLVRVRPPGVEPRQLGAGRSPTSGSARPSPTTRCVVAPVTQMMMNSRQNLVNYMEPLGLVHMMGTDHHYGPAPWVRAASAPPT